MLQYTVLDMVKRPFVIYKDTFTNQCCLDPRRGIDNKKAMVISLPRSGVHLMQEIISSLGLQHVRINHDKNSLGDYRFLSDQDRINFARTSDSYSFPFSESYKWVIDGQFVHNHLRYDDSTFSLLQNSSYMMYLLKRDLRTCLISHARQKQKESACLPKDPKKLMETYITLPYYKEIYETVKLMMPWYTNNTFTVIEYESLTGQRDKNDQYQTILRLIEDFENTRLQMDDVINSCVCKKTFTFSGEISELDKYWNDNIEKWFIDTEFQKMNKELGYT